MLIDVKMDGERAFRVGRWNSGGLNFETFVELFNPVRIVFWISGHNLHIMVPIE